MRDRDPTLSGVRLSDEYSSVAFNGAVVDFPTLPEPEKRPCPYCDKPTRFLPKVSQSALVDYHCCDDCRYVWRFNKPGTEKPPRAITM
jgi:hypothetical protein